MGVKCCDMEGLSMLGSGGDHCMNPPPPWGSQQSWGVHSAHPHCQHPYRHPKLHYLLLFTYLLGKHRRQMDNGKVK